MKNFMLEMSEEEKDSLSCDEVFALYLRHVSKLVNENYYRNVLRFVLLYRECLNEYGWLKRRDHYHKAYQGHIDEHDEVLAKLKKEEQAQEEEENERIAAIKAKRLERRAQIRRRKEEIRLERKRMM